jgi:hypothetical protein
MSAKRIFISHSSADKPFVNRLLRRLQDHGLDNSWYDVREIGATSNLPNSMAEGVSSADYFAIILSSSAALSQWVSFEIQQALNLNKPVLALMNAPNSERANLLTNPFINKLLQGGQLKVLDFTISFDDAVLDLIREIAPEVGAKLAIEERLRVIFEDDDPDVAERAMGFAALEAASHIPGLFLRLGSLRNERRMRYRGERLCCHIGEELVDFLFAAVTLQLQLPDPPVAAPPAHVLETMKSSSQSVVTGNQALDWLRYIIFNPLLAQRSSTQLGAKFCLVALGKQNARLKSRIVATINDWFGDVTSSIVNRRGQQDAFDDEFYDALRSTIEAAGELAPDPALNPFVFREFVTESLWGSHSEHAKGKLTKGVVKFLSKSADANSLSYLISLVEDPSPTIQDYVRDNAFSDCFVRFGGGATEPLLKLIRDWPSFTLGALKNLAAIRDPLANREVLKRIFNEALNIEDRCDLLWILAGNTVPETANTLVSAYRNADASLQTDDEYLQNRIACSVARAVRFVPDRQVVEQMTERHLSHPEVYAALQAVQTVGELGLFRQYEKLLEIFKTSTVPQLRGQAAISLARRDAFTRDAVLSRLQFAEPQYELSLLSIALSYFEDANAIPGLIKGLQDTFESHNEELHDAFAAALARMTLDDAKLARQKWYQRR